jgi:murein DD-endopeptidase MepM/ murein hydrolase activator NlpD
MPIYAYARGIVLQAGPFANGSYSPGSTIDIQHPNNGQTRYAHLSRVNVNVGDRIAAGKRIGTSGSDHLHFEWKGMPTLNQRDAGGLVPWLAKGGLVAKKEGKNGRVISLPTGTVSGITGTQLKELIKTYSELSATAVQVNENMKTSGDTASGLPAAGMTPESAKKFAKLLMLKKYGWGENQFAALKTLWERESGWRWNADNPTSDAYGIPQALPGSKMGKDWKDNPETQIRWGLRYIKGRYGTPEQALAFWDNNNWYGRGGMVIPQLRKGATINYDNTLANLHKGETVLTAPLTNKLRDNVASSGEVVYNVDIRIDKASATPQEIDVAVHSALDRHSARVGRRRRV